MATLNFPDNPDTGDTYSDANSGFEYEWNGTVWISKDASTSGKRGNIQEIDDISGAFNGSNTDFILNVASNAIEPTDAQQVVISVGGVLQNSGDDYTIVGSTITFTTAPADGLTFFGTYLNPYLSVNTVADNTVSTGSLAASGNYTVGGINVTGVSTLSGLTFTGISSIGTLNSSNLAVTGVGTIANVIHTKDSSGLGATMGAAVGVVTYLGDGSNLSGIGITIFPYTYSPGIGSTSIAVDSDIVTTWNTLIQVGSGTITIRSGSASGTVVDQFVVGSSSSITIAANSLTLNPAVTLAGGTEHFVTYPAGTIQALGGQHQNEQLIYSFTTQTLTNQLWGFGNGAYGMLGQNDTVSYSSPVQLPGDPVWEKINWGNNQNEYILGVKDDSTLWSWGNNEDGVIGNNSNTHYSSPVQLPGTNWSKSFTGSQRAPLCVKTDGTLWTWGANNFGVLGLNQSLPVKISSPAQVGTDTTWTTTEDKVKKGGNYHTAFIKTDGTLWVWGNNGSGMLGLNQGGTFPAYPGSRSSPTQVGTNTTWSVVSCMRSGIAALKTDGTLWTWGRGAYGFLGHNDTVERSSPTQLPGTNWSTLSAAYGALATKTDGTLWAWGRNAYNGRLGQNSEINYSSPVQIPGTTWDKIEMGFANLATKTDGTLWSWGYNGKGAIGLNDTISRSSPTQLPGFTDPVNFSTGRRNWVIKLG